MTLAALLSLMAIHLAAAVSPGPAFVVAVQVAASRGFMAALALAFGFGLGAMVWAAAALLGLSVLFQIAPGFLTGLKFVGAAFLLFIAWMMWRHADAPLPQMSDSDGTRSLFQEARLGFATQLANPKAAIFFGAVFIGLVPPGLTAGTIAVLLACILVVETAWYGVVARAFSIPVARRGYVRFKAGIERLFGVFLAGFSAKIALG